MTSQTDQLVLEPSHWEGTLGTPPTSGCCSREAGAWGAQQQNIKWPAPEHDDGPRPIPSGGLSQAGRDQSPFQDRWDLMPKRSQEDKDNTGEQEGDPFPGQHSKCRNSLPSTCSSSHLAA